MSIFDNIIGDMSSFGDAVASSLEGAGSLKVKDSAQASSDASEYRTLRLQNLLDSGKMPLSYQSPREFIASKSKPTEAVDPENIKQQWLQRLNRYSSIAAETGVKR